MRRPRKRWPTGWWALTGSGLILPGLLAGCGSTGHRGWWRIDNCATIPRGAIPPPYGTHTNAVLYNQAVRAEAEDFVIYKHEWYLGGRELGPDGRRHLAKLADRLTREPYPVVVEPVEPEELPTEPKDAAADLNRARRTQLVDALLALGLKDADKRVVIAYPTAEGLYGDTAVPIGRQYLGGQGGFGANGNFSGGGGVGSGGIGGGINAGGLGGIGGVGGGFR